MSRGFYLMTRGWRDNPVFKKEPYTEREAWQWLIEDAAYADRQTKVSGRIISLRRGQLCHSLRFLAEAWSWTKDRVRRYLAMLERAGMIRLDFANANRDSDETADGEERDKNRDSTSIDFATAVKIITVCNYCKYQARSDADETGGDDETRQERDSNDQTPRQEPQQQRDRLERTKTTKSYSADFEKFWEVYPNRYPHANPKRTAAAAFAKAISSGATAEALIEGARRYAARIASTSTDPKFVAQAVTWINQGRWDDQTEPPARPVAAPKMRAVI